MKTGTLKILLCLAGIFVLGAASGFVVGKRTGPVLTRASLRAIMAPGTNRSELANQLYTRWSEKRISEYSQTLKLSPDQETAVRRHFAALGKDFEAVRTDARARLASALIRVNQEIARELTPDQRKVFMRHMAEQSRKLDPTPGNSPATQ